MSGAETLGDDAIDDRHGDVRGGNRAQNAKERDRPAADPAIGRARQPKSQDDGADERNHHDIAVNAAVGSGARQSPPRRVAAAQPVIEGTAAFRNQVIAGIAFAAQRLVRLGGRVAGLHCLRDGLRGDLDLAMPGIARDELDRAAIVIACRKIHGGEIARRAQRRVDKAHALEPFGPIDRRDQPHARDHVAHGDVHRALALNFAADDLIGGRSFRREPVVQPLQRRRDIGITVAQPLGQLDGEGGGPGNLIEAMQDGGGGFVAARFGSKRPIRQRVGLPAGVETRDDHLCQAAQILDEGDAQRDRDGPQLADGERLDALIRDDQAGQFQNVEGAIGMGDQGPGDTEDARVSGQRAVRELRQQAIEARRQIVLDLADLLVHDVEIVEQPFCRRRDRLARARRADDRAVGVDQDFGIGIKPRRVPSAGSAVRNDALRGREAFGMLLQPLDAEQLGANGFLERRERVGAVVQRTRGADVVQGTAPALA